MLAASAVAEPSKRSTSLSERSLFDWSIVEEAGKAAGGELLSPMLLSHRRLHGKVKPQMRLRGSAASLSSFNE
jgi:hypothetical protein